MSAPIIDEASRIAKTDSRWEKATVKTNGEGTDGSAQKTGCLYLVSVGPGRSEYICPQAKEAISRSDVIASYELYLTWVKPLLDKQKLITTPLTQERERAQISIDAARQGKKVSLLSSGDIGVYAMASLVFELMQEDDQFQVEVIPGITAATACASIAGAPLSHDFATLSLSDLLCPMNWIEERARAVGKADLCLALYNVQSEKRQEGVYKIIDILLKAGKNPQTLCAVVKNAYRPAQESYITTLSELRQKKFDMFTSIIVGNRFTRRKRNWIYTPRGYGDWQEAGPEPPQADAVWVFSGTSDGNEAALKIKASGRKVVVSVASDYGAGINKQTMTDAAVPVICGSLGEAKRKELLKQSSCKAVVDATHPYAQKISKQLSDICAELNIPYLRLEREASRLPAHAVIATDFAEAATRAMELGERIFLSTGSKELPTFLSAPSAANKQWFLRILPDPDLLERAVALGIPRSNICAMQGPFSQAINEALWRDWRIDCVVTKDSGSKGGLSEKIKATENLALPLIVVARPPAASPRNTHKSVPQLIEALNHLNL